MNELAEAVKKTLIDRINTPLFGFIVISWVMFNWDNILFVMFSQLTIEQRISGLRAEGGVYWKGLICPAATGFILSVLFPYLQWGVSFLQRHAQKLIDQNAVARERLECETIKELAESRASAENAVEISRADMDTVLSQKRKDKADIDFATTNLEEQHAKLVTENADKSKELVELNEKIHIASSREQELREIISHLEIDMNNYGNTEEKIKTLHRRYSKTLEKIDMDIMSLKDVIAENNERFSRKGISFPLGADYSGFHILSNDDSRKVSDSVAATLGRIKNNVDMLRDEDVNI
ncbi:hypothetical protein KVO79_03605 [Serratia quinivorans]|uniref:hypothetical protein n=1 Tax=Serratia quinivorans TaxID=137545 RepID=UPI001C494E66|nr:hypothetical protein [Serratia quinivorans]MBV6691186.1 hypothetical protein [Serratia quinivorans]